MLNFIFAGILAFLTIIFAPWISPINRFQEENRGDMTFTLLDTSNICKDCSVVQASGEIGTKTTEAYYNLTRHAPARKSVYLVLDSLGGVRSGAMQLGRTLREQKVNTIVGQAVVCNGEVEIEPATCASACVHVFVGGTTRSMANSSRLGVHTSLRATVKDEGTNEERENLEWLRRRINQHHFERISRQTAEYMEYLEIMGIDLRLATLALKPPHDSIAWLSSRDRSLWSVTTIDTRLGTPADRRFPVLFFPPEGY
jgi:hypothetical protein